LHDFFRGGEAGEYGAGVDVLERFFEEPFIFGVVDFEGTICGDAEAVSVDLSLG